MLHSAQLHDPVGSPPGALTPRYLGKVANECTLTIATMTRQRQPEVLAVRPLYLELCLGGAA